IEAMLVPIEEADPEAADDEKNRLARMRDAHRIEDAATKLMQPYVTANANRNTKFRDEYTRTLLKQVMKPLLSNHLFARVAAMVVLSRSADPQAIPIFASVLKDKNQPLSVKERAAVGLLTIADSGRRNLDPGSQAIPAASALAEFLEADADIFWPVQAR